MLPKMDSLIKSFGCQP